MDSKISSGYVKGSVALTSAYAHGTKEPISGATDVDRLSSFYTMVIQKFGGPSLANANMIGRCVDVLAEQIRRPSIVVVAAMEGVTDSLVKLSEAAASGNAALAAEITLDIRNLHANAQAELCESAGTSPENGALSVEPLLEQLESLVEGLLLLRECSPRTLDTLLAFGELLVSRLVARCAGTHGLPILLVDARSFFITDDSYNSAVPNQLETTKRINELVSLKSGKLIITQGFIGATDSGATTTIGRGGSDFTAAIIGAAVGASEIQIWTNVSGILTCDPSVVASAKTVGKVSYSEAAELAFFGSNVVHPSTLQPAMDSSIPILIRNAVDPTGRYTVIVERCYETGVRSITGKRSVTLINISSSRMLNAHGFLSRFFTIFAENQTSVDLIATSEVSVTLSIDNLRNITQIVRSLKEIGTVTIERDMAIVSLVGQDLWKDSSFVAEVFSVMREIPIRMISLGSSDINLSVVVSNDFFDIALQSLHLQFFGTA